MHSSIRFLSFALFVVLAACEGERRSPAAVTDPWLPPAPAGRLFPESPRIDAVFPTFASPGMTVRIRGAGFGSDAATVSVWFGGVAAIPQAVEDGEISIRPVAGGEVEADGTTKIRVTIGGLTSNDLSMRVGQMGDIDRIETAAPETVGGLLALADGSRLVSDPIGGRLHRIDPLGIVHAVADPENRLQAPGRLAMGPAGELLVFDPAAAAVWAYHAGSDSFASWRSGTAGWSDGASVGGRLFVIASGAGTIERVEADGSTTGFLPLGACDGARSIAALDGVLYVAAGARVCAVDAEGAGETELTLQGEIVYDVQSLRAGNGRLLATGIFTQGPAVASIAASGEVALEVAAPRGFPTAVAAQGEGLLLGMADGNVLNVDASGVRLLATRVRDLGAIRAVGSRYVVTGGYEVPFLAELRADGAYRVLAVGESPSMWTHVEPDGDGFLIAAFDAGLVLRVGAGGSISTVLEHWSIGPVASFVRVEGGDFVLSAYGPDLARYSADGTLLDAHHVHATDASTFGLALFGTKVLAAAGDRLLEADAVEGGAATTRLLPGLAGLLGIAVTPESRIYAVDGNDTGKVVRLDGNAMSTVGQAGAAVSLGIAPDGAILVADLADVPYRMFP